MTTSGIHTRAPGSAAIAAAPVSPRPATGKAPTNKQPDTAVQSPAQAEHTARSAPPKSASIRRLDITA